MARLGTFDQVAAPIGWFAREATAAAWFAVDAIKTESVVTGTIYNEALAGAVSLADQLAASAVFANASSHTVGASDSFASSVTFQNAHAAAVAPSDVFASAQAFAESVAASIIAAETYVPGVTINATAAHSVGLTDGFSPSCDFSGGLNDAVAPADLSDASADWADSLGEPVEPVDAVAATLDFSEVLAEQVILPTTEVPPAPEPEPEGGPMLFAMFSDFSGDEVTPVKEMTAQHVMVEALVEPMTLDDVMTSVTLGFGWPSPDKVLAGVQYGPTGIEYTGTATAGPGATVFASSFMVFIDEPQLYVDLSKESKPVRQVSEAPVKPGKEVKRLFVTTIPEEITVTTQPNTLNIVEVKL